jgi:hypothetical protein
MLERVLDMATKISLPITSLRSELEVSNLIVKRSEMPVEAHLINEIEVKSKEQPHVSLGNYIGTLPKGFAVHVNPASSSDTIVTQVTRLGIGDEYELVLHIANYSDQTISVGVWRL